MPGGRGIRGADVMKLMILDGNSMANRAFYGIKPLSAPDGTPTNAVFGFISILQRLLDEERPDSLCVAFDLPAPTFRHKMYSGYKATRRPMPDELAAQMPVLRRLLDVMGVKLLEAAGWEADDILGTVGRICESEGWDCVIVSGDRDSLQLITDKVHVKYLGSHSGIRETLNYDPALFREKYGFEPPLLVDFKALMGDKSDNIPGIDKVGEKTAADLIQRFGGLDSIYKTLADPDVPDLRKSLREKILQGEESARLSYALAEIRRDVPIEFAPADALWSLKNSDELYSLMRSLNFSKFIDKWGLRPQTAGEEMPPLLSGCEYTRLRTEEELDAALAELKGKRVYFYCASPDYTVFRSGGDAWLLDSAGYAGDFNSALKKLFSPEVKKCGHDVKDIQLMLLKNGVETGTWCFDTALAAYLIDSTASDYSLEHLCLKYAGFIPEAEEQNVQLSLLPDAEPAEYCVKKAGAVQLLEEKLSPLLSELGLDKVMYEIELPLCSVLAAMELKGFCVDKNALRVYGDSMNDSLDSLERSIQELSGHEFNVNSPKQLGEVLFDEMGLPSGKKTKSGWSTDAETLEKIAAMHPIVPQILEYRMLKKLKGTYADGLLKVISRDGRIHTNFRMTATATGRLSSTEPNLQNIPVRKELGSEMRKMFVAPEGSVLVDADYSQIELRILAHVSGDEAMRSAFISGADIHRTTASQVFGVPEDEVTPTQRSHAKAVNFGIVYGISAFSLSQDIGVWPSEAKSYIDSYLQRFSGVRDYMKKVIGEAREKGYAETVYGRRRPMPELRASNFNTRSAGERIARNMPIQGTAADIIKIAMINVYRRFRAEGLKAELILQVHDELIAECPESEAERVKTVLREEMEGAASLSVPLTVDAKTGRSWAEAH